MDRVSLLLGALSRALAFIAGLGTLVTMIVICADVTLRFFGNAVPGTAPLVANYLMVMVAFLPLAWVEQKGIMIQVDVLTPLLSRLAAALLDIMVLAVSIAVYLFLFHATLAEALDRYRVGAYEVTLGTTVLIWPAYFIVPIALGMAALVTATKLVIIVLMLGWPRARDA